MAPGRRPPAGGSERGRRGGDHGVVGENVLAALRLVDAEVPAQVPVAFPSSISRRAVARSSRKKLPRRGASGGSCACQ